MNIALCNEEAPFSTAGAVVMNAMKENERLVKALRNAVEEAFSLIRNVTFDDPYEDADNPILFFPTRTHIGEPGQAVDQLLHQILERTIRKHLPDALVIGEERHPTGMAFSKTFRLCAVIDALDGTAQLKILSGAWGVVALLYGINPDDLNDWMLLAAVVVDAEGGVVTNGRLDNFVELGRVDSKNSWIHSDRGLNSGKKPMIAMGSYKPSATDVLAKVRGELGELLFFNAGGSPSIRKIITYPEAVMITPASSTVWDGIGALLIQRAGGYVVLLGETEPCAEKQIMSWYDQFPFKPTGTGSAYDLVPIRTVPPHVAGRDQNHVMEIARRLKQFY